MSIHFSPREVIEMAERIERNGATFYRLAAEVARDEGVRARLLELAAWEDGHERLFATILETLSGAEAAAPTYDPSGDAVLYLKTMADLHVFRADSAARLIKGTETVREILDLAISFERDSILFFEGLEPFVPEPGRDKVLALIAEERRHVAFLARERARLG